MGSDGDRPVVRDASDAVVGSLGSKPLRIALFGNVANALYELGLALQAVPDIDAHLYVSTQDAPASRPENVDPELQGHLPAWVHDGNWITAATVVAPWRAAITRELHTYDLVLVSGPGPIFAQWARRPWCWYVTGADLTVKPFPITFRSWYSTWGHRAGELVGGMWQRRAARRVDRMWIQPFAPMIDAARRLRVPSSALSDRFPPLVVDTDLFRPDREVSSPDDPVLRRMLDADFTVFHPSRLVIHDEPRLRRTGQWKGNDVLVRGFARLVASGRVERPLLVMPDSTLSRDLDEVKALVDDLGIGEQVLWAPPPAADGFPRQAMVDLYLASDVVADEFGVGWYGYVTLEALAVGRPVVSYVDAAVMARLYPDGHPIVSARTESEVAEALVALALDGQRRRDLGTRGRTWVVDHHSPGRVRGRYVDGVRELVSELGSTGS